MSPSLPVAWVAPNPSTDSEMRLQVHSGLRLRLYLPRGRWLSELQAWLSRPGRDPGVPVLPKDPLGRDTGRRRGSPGLGQKRIKQEASTYFAGGHQSREGTPKAGILPWVFG